MSGEVIKSFLVGLGFDVDDATLAKFNKAISSATLRVTALYATVKLATTGILYAISEISDGFEKMGYEYRLIAPTVNKTLQLRQETIRAYKAAGVNIIKVIQDSIKLNLSLAKTKIAFEAIYRSAASRFFGLITKQSDDLRKKIYANMPKIIALVERFVKFVFRMSEALTAFGLRVGSILGRVYDFFVELDRVTDGWSTKILALIAVWKVLNLSFLATPLGLLFAGIVALIALYDDFKVWKEGGDSFFDWTAALPKIQAVSDLLNSLKNVVLDVASAFKDIWNSDWSKVLADLSALLGHLNGINEAVDKLARSFKIFDGILAWRDKIDASVMNFFNGGASAGVPVAPPLGVGGNQSAITNQNVHQQTQINVTGSADANAVGKAVSGEQNRVNFDAARNFRKAAQ